MLQCSAFCGIKPVLPRSAGQTCGYGETTLFVQLFSKPDGLTLPGRADRQLLWVVQINPAFVLAFTTKWVRTLQLCSYRSRRTLLLSTWGWKGPCFSSVWVFFKPWDLPRSKNPLVLQSSSAGNACMCSVWHGRRPCGATHRTSVLVWMQLLCLRVRERERQRYLSSFPWSCFVSCTTASLFVKVNAINSQNNFSLILEIQWQCRGWKGLAKIL